jgi:hypothetical protein
VPAGFAVFAAYGDFATGVLALLTVRMRPLSGFFVDAFNLVGAADIPVDYDHVTRPGLPYVAASWAPPIIYVSMLMITHAAAFYWLVRPGPGFCWFSQ